MPVNEQALNVIRSILSENSDLGIEEKKLSSGYSYFKNGIKQVRLFKLTNALNKVNLEINVDLDMDKFKENASIDKIDRLTAYEKHLGTMVYRYRSENLNDLGAIIKVILNKL